jgi:hypothetical protein
VEGKEVPLGRTTTSVPIIEMRDIHNVNGSTGSHIALTVVRKGGMLWQVCEQKKQPHRSSQYVKIRSENISILVYQLSNSL